MGSVTVNAIKGAASNRDRSNTARLYGIKCKPHFAMGMVMTIATGEVSEVPEPFFEGRISKNRRHILKSRSQILTSGSNEMRLSRLVRDGLIYV
jgi:hypothetical protein